MKRFSAVSIFFFLRKIICPFKIHFLKSKFRGLETLSIETVYYIMLKLLLVLIGLSLGQLVNSECANACNGHGKCTSYDMCICHRNWQVRAGTMISKL